MSADEVHAALRGTGDTSKVVVSEGKRATVEEYALPDGNFHVEYDGVPSRSGQHVVLVRQALPQSYESVTALLKRFGGPSAGRDALVQGLQPGPAVWVDKTCDLVLTYYRRTESWYAEEVNTFLRVESLSHLPAESPASETVQAYLASGAPPPPAYEPPPEILLASAPAPAPPPEVLRSEEHAFDAPPVRTRYVRPTYPPGARKLGVRGEVTLHLSIEKSGAISGAKIARARPEGYGFEEAALDAAKLWAFSPASRDGKAVDGEVDIVVQFK
jgi:protein TonB